LKNKKLVLGLSALLFLALFVPFAFFNFVSKEKSVPEDFYWGVTAGGNITDTKRLIDRTKGFTNLLIITNLEITKNRTNLEEVLDYAYNAGLHFYVHVVYPSLRVAFDYNPFEWAYEAKERYGNQFLGYYLWDEPGGNQLDLGGFKQFDNSTMPYDYRDAANTFVYYLYIQMRDFIKIDNLVTSDYGLYWYDYEAGYDSVFCEFGWNNTRAVNIALCRGAAEMHNKTWGVMITWTYDQEPYIESASELYQDMITAYGAGAKYIAVFNYPNIEPYGLLTEDHFSAIEEFRDFVNQNPQNRTTNQAKVAYVLPENYGWGFRTPDDKIWGVWEADSMAEEIWNDINDLTQEYEYDFDVIYSSPWTTFFWRDHYDKTIWWNGT
jgi:hypothetical protein